MLNYIIHFYLSRSSTIDTSYMSTFYSAILSINLLWPKILGSGLPMAIHIGYNIFFFYFFFVYIRLISNSLNSKVGGPIYMLTYGANYIQKYNSKIVATSVILINLTISTVHLYWPTLTQREQYIDSRRNFLLYSRKPAYFYTTQYTAIVCSYLSLPISASPPGGGHDSNLDRLTSESLSLFGFYITYTSAYLI